MIKPEKLILESRLSKHDCLSQLAQAMSQERHSAAKPLHGFIKDDAFQFKAAWFLYVNGLVQEQGQASRIILSFDVPGGLVPAFSGSFAFLMGTTFSVLAHNQKSSEMDVLASYWTALILIFAPSLVYAFAAAFIFGSHHASQKRIVRVISSICQCVSHESDLVGDAGSDKLSAAKKDMVLNVVIHVLPLLAGWFLVPYVIENLHKEAWQMWTIGDYKKSEGLCRPIVLLSELIDGKKGKKTAYAKYITAECCRCAGELEEAQRLYKESLEAQLNNYDKNDPRIAWTYDNLGRVQEKMGYFRLAEQSYEKAINTWKSDKNWQEPLIARVKDRQALMYLDKLRVVLDKNKPAILEQAQNTMAEALEIDRNIFKKEGTSFTVAQDLNDFGVIKYVAGDKCGAQKCFELSLAQKKQIGQDAVSTAKTMMNLSFVTGNASLKNEALKIWCAYLVRDSEGLSNEKLLALILQRTNNQYEYPNVYARIDKVIPEALN